MVYQVYLNWTGNQYDGREILVFPNRQYADEFYNRCITAKTITKPLDDIVRHAPQFWSFFMNDESRPFDFIKSNAKDLIPTTMVARISGYDNNHATGAMPIVLNDPTSNVEYRSGGSYYIRTKSKPHLYWFVKDTSTQLDTRKDTGIFLDTRKATKFRIHRDESERNRQPDDHVLERKDLVQLSALNASGSLDIGVLNHVVTTTHSPFQFSFGSFYNGNFGVDWSPQGNDSYPVYETSYAGEEWELVN